jgi:F0F1-type ATP synthase membrane subunit c/vacuolar-type H+-ATPase subunit K
LGGIPTAFIYASLGAGLGQALTSERSLMAAARAPGVILPLAALAVLSLAPTLFRRFRRRLEL